MSIAAFESVVDDGVIRPAQPLNLRDRTKVYILVPEAQPKVPVIVSPRLAHSNQVADFRVEVTDG